MIPTVAQTVSSSLTLKSIKQLKFAQKSEFLPTLNRRIEDFFETSNRNKRDVPRFYFKVVILFFSLIITYISLVFFAQTWWQALGLSIILGLIMDGIGFNLQHDGSHNACSNITWINKLMGTSLDLIGFSSYYWKIGHNVLHHNYINITGYDQDFEFGILARKTPFQKWHPHHRWQHYYLWFLYGMYAIEWSLLRDFNNFFDGKLDHLDYPRPRGLELVIFILGKALFLTLAFVIPLQFHSFWAVLFCYMITAFTMGLVMNFVFLLGHEVEKADFLIPSETTGKIEKEWSTHKIESTINCSFNPFLNWFCGGLNYHIEHHLFPTICHVNYADMSPIVKKTCEEFGIKYQVNPSFRYGVLSHFRLLRRLGKQP